MVTCRRDRVDGSNACERRREGDEMNDRRRHVFRIEPLSKDTLAMRDLAAYITDLAELLGNHDSVHFHEIRDGSVEVVFDVEASSTESMVERMLDARHSTGEPSARNAWRSLNQRLKRDGASGTVVEQTERAPRRADRDSRGAGGSGGADADPVGSGHGGRHSDRCRRPSPQPRMGFRTYRRLGHGGELRSATTHGHRDRPTPADDSDPSRRQGSMGAR